MGCLNSYPSVSLQTDHFVYLFSLGLGSYIQSLVCPYPPGFNSSKLKRLIRLNKYKICVLKVLFKGFRKPNLDCRIWGFYIQYKIIIGFHRFRLPTL